MSILRKILNTLRPETLSAELERELNFHVTERVDELRAQGMTEADALREARKAFGNHLARKEETRDMNITAWLDVLWNDLVYSWRQLRLNPGFALVAILSLALGIGANTAIFQLIDAVRLRGLPVERPWELASLERGRDFFTSGSYTSRNVAFTFAQIESLQRHQQAFSDLLFFNEARFNMGHGGRPRYANGLFVSSNFLHVLGVTPLLGHGFPLPEFPSHDPKTSVSSPGHYSLIAGSCANPGVVISHAFWQAEFGGRMDAVGKPLLLEGQMLPVVGVLPAGFYGVEPGLQFDLAVPLCAEQLFAAGRKNRLQDKSAWWLTIIGRMKPGWNVTKTSQHLRAISPLIFRESLSAEYRPDSAKRYLKNKLEAISASAGVSSVRRQYESPLWILMCITGLLLLIACANLANLLLARASAREREMAVRQALGASRSRLILQMLTESALLSFAGAVAGALLAQVLTRSLVVFLRGSGSSQLMIPLSFNARIFFFSCTLACLTCLLFGLLPALRASAAMPAQAMRGSRTSTATRERHLLRRFLVVSQVALSMVLLVGAILFTRSLQHLFNNSLGFNAKNVLVATVTATSANFPREAYRAQLFRNLENRFAAVPGVSSFSTVFISPLSGSGWNESIKPDSGASTSGRKLSWFNSSGPGYFNTMSTPLLGGRDFNSHDDRHAPSVAIVNQTFAKQFFQRSNPVGRSFRVEEDAGKADRVYQVVGLIGDTKYSELKEAPQPIVFVPTAQEKAVGAQRTFVFRVTTGSDSIARKLQQQVAAIDPNLLVDFTLLEIQIRDSVLRERLMANLTAGFGFLAACLSTLGLYGVMSYLVTRRRSEIGIRLAIGANRANVFRLIVRDALLMVAVGLAFGIAGSLLLSRYAESVVV